MTPLRPLGIVPAGAGSGKTFAVQQRLGEWVAEGKVAPERILAVTYTKAAATELRDRISATLLGLGRAEDALRLSEAYITTIHGFGLRVLTEFAFEAGASPQPRLVNEYEQSTLIRRALARTDRADAIAERLEAFGYSYDFGNQRAAVDVFRDEILAAIQLLRSAARGSAGITDRLDRNAVGQLSRRYGPTADEEQLREQAILASSALLREYPASMHETHGSSKAAREDLIRDFRNLRRAAHTDGLRHDWKLWQELRTLRRSSESVRAFRRAARQDSSQPEQLRLLRKLISRSHLKMPERYDELAEEVIAAASHLCDHPGPLRQAVEHLGSLLGAARGALEHYDDAKRQAGLVDYDDMIAMASLLLRSNRAALDTLVGRLDCMVVDEFQDTNPSQFELLWKLRDAGVPTLVVGDLKQAIMGFQGADPRLFEALIDSNPQHTSPLTANWRSQPRLMHVINAFGRALFHAKPKYTPLQPKAQASPLEPLEIVWFRKNPRAGGRRVRAYTIGERIQQMLADPSQQVIDRNTNRPRRLRGGDIAVLCQTHRALETYAATLRTMGLQVNYAGDGWLESRAIQLARHALAYLANPADRHAALYLAVTELGSLSLEEGLRQLMEQGRVEDPLLRKLDDLSELVADGTIYALVADTLAALDLFDHAAVWLDGEQARANLVHLLGLAAEFMNSNREALAHGGYHGGGIQTFLAWLTARAEQDNREPEKRVLDEDAVVLKTWHSSKGLEWPVVAVCQLDHKFEARLPDLALAYESFADLSRLLEHVQIDYWPKYACPESNLTARVVRRATAETEARRLLYVALTRARDRLILEWPAYQEKQWRNASRASGQLEDALASAGLRLDTGSDLHLNDQAQATLQAVSGHQARNLPGGRSFWSLLRERCSLDMANATLKVDGEQFPCQVTEGRIRLPDEACDTTPETSQSLPVTGRRAIVRASASGELTPDSRRPSDPGEQHTLALNLRQERYGAGLDLALDLFGAELGTFLHRCFEVLGSRPELASRIPELTGVEADPGTIAAVAAAAESFESWLGTCIGCLEVLREWPLLRLDGDGSVVSGTADLLARTATGVWVIDHKSDNIKDPLQAFQIHSNQLAAYAGSLAAQETQVLGVGINWIRLGVVTLHQMQ